MTEVDEQKGERPGSPTEGQTEEDLWGPFGQGKELRLSVPCDTAIGRCQQGF